MPRGNRAGNARRAEPVPFDRAAILRARNRVAELLRHDLHQCQEEILLLHHSFCDQWLSNPDNCRDNVRLEVTNLLTNFDNLPRICHLESKYVGAICEAAMTLVGLVGFGSPHAGHSYSGADEYGDVLEALTRILRCEICFGDEPFNQIDPATNRKHDWTDIARLLECYRSELPINSSSNVACLQADVGAPILTSLRKVSDILFMNFNTLAWNIVKYNLHLDAPGGPRMAIRNGDFTSLAKHTTRSIGLARLLKGQAVHSKAVESACHRLIQVAQCVQFRWFEYVGSSRGDQTVSDETIKLCRRLAATGDPRSDRRLLNEPLFDLMWFGGLEERHVNSGQLQREFVDQYDIYHILRDLKSSSDQQEISRDDMMNCSVQRRNVFSDLLKEKLGQGVEEKCIDSILHREPIPGYVLTSRHAIPRERARALLLAYEDLVRLHTRVPSGRAVEDMNLTLLTAILQPGRYTTQFLRTLRTAVGLPADDLSLMDIFRLPGRGLASTHSFDGFFLVAQEWRDLPDNPTILAERMIQALENKDQESLSFYRFNSFANNRRALYEPGVRSLALPLLTAISHHAEKTLRMSNQESRRNTLRLFDLTLTFQSIIRSDAPGTIFGDGRIPIEKVIEVAGETEQKLNLAGLTRNMVMGLVWKESKYNPAHGSSIPDSDLGMSGVYQMCF